MSLIKLLDLDLNTNRHKNKATATIGLVVHAAGIIVY